MFRVNQAEKEKGCLARTRDNLWANEFVYLVEEN